jgi:transposase
MQALCQGLANSPEFIYVGDSAIYSNILEHSANLYWITRVPETIKEARKLISLDCADHFIKLDNGYSYYPIRSHYGNVAQRWVLFFSEAAYEREIKTLNKKIKQEYEDQNKEWWHLSNQIFTCQSDALTVLKAKEKILKYHKVNACITEMKKHTKRGRPRNSDVPELIGYQVQYTLQLNEPLVEMLKSQKGRFILATNQLDEALLSHSDVLKEYKAQSGTEAGFKFIKDDAFEVDSVFLKTPSRIEALLMIMTLCLMIYGVTEYELHQSLKNKKETTLNQVKKPTATPSLRWIYFLFRSVSELSVKNNNNETRLIINMTGITHQIISHFGKRAHAIYMNPG